MPSRMLGLYDKKSELIGTIIEHIYILSMTVIIFLGHNVEGYVGTHSYKLFATLFMAFGLWTLEIKNKPMKKMSFELIIKFITVTIAAMIIAKLTGEMKLSGLYSSFFYPLFIIALYLLKNRKSKWGKDLYCSSREYLKFKFGRSASVIPDVILFFAVLMPGILNASTLMFIFSLVFGFTIEHLFVGFLFAKSKRMNEKRII